MKISLSYEWKISFETIIESFFVALPFYAIMTGAGFAYRDNSTITNEGIGCWIGFILLIISGIILGIYTLRCIVGYLVFEDSELSNASNEKKIVLSPLRAVFGGGVPCVLLWGLIIYKRWLFA